ncbi:MAG: SprB repeat-containing protein, partial [Bacteroidota bacterium]
MALPDPGISSNLLVCDVGPTVNLISELGGTPDAGGSWTDGLGNPFGGTFDPAIHFPGTYTYTIPGTAPCGPQSSTLAITVAPSPDISLVSFVDVACLGDNSGSITVSGSGGTAPLQFAINNGPFQASPTFPGLPAATYQVAVQDANGCRDSLTQSLTEPTLLVVQIDSVRPVDCQGNSTGFISGSGQGGVGPYEYSIDGLNYFPSGSFPNLSASTYTFFVRDANSCVSTTLVLVGQPELLVANIGSQTNVDCFGNATGSVSLNVGGGIGPYLLAIDGITFLPQTTFSGLAAGTYTITIEDSNLCTTTLPVTITEPSLLIANIPALTGVDCFGNSSGELTGGASGGTAPYEYSLDGVSFSPTNTFAGLGAGFYTLFVQDGNDCLASIDTSLTSPTGLISTMDSVAMVLCNGGNNGWIGLFSQGGVGPYSYSLDGITYGPNASFPGLTAGTYTVFTQDANGCIVSLNQTITEPPALVLNLDNQINVLCNGDSSASVSFSAFGGVGGYEFTIDGVNYQTSGDFGQLPAGNYFFSVRDSHLCQTTLPITITEPSSVLIQLSRQQEVDCFGNLSGEIEVEGGGGTPAYSFSLDGGPFGPGQTFTGLGQGTYTSYVQDGNGCLDSLSVTISEPDSLVATIVQVVMVDCYANATGSVEVLVSGGSPTYEYVLNGGTPQTGNSFTDLTAGFYQITVTDDSSCVDTSSILITQPDSLDLAVSSVRGVDCFGNATGAIHLFTQGGSPEYQYSLDGNLFQSDSFFVGLVAAPYQIEVLDDQGCRDTLLVPIVEPPLLTGLADSVVDVACFGDSTGWISVLASGGSPAYQYQLDGGAFQSDSFFPQLPTGLYPIVIRDDSLCEAQFEVNIMEPPLLQAVIEAQKNSSCYGDSTGWVEILATGGTLPYQYSLDGINFQDTLRFEGLAAGMYQITVQDSQLCTTIVPVDITQPDSIVVSFPQLLPVDFRAFVRDDLALRLVPEDRHR